MLQTDSPSYKSLHILQYTRGMAQLVLQKPFSDLRLLSSGMLRHVIS
jgi:hypothetical protein